MRKAIQRGRDASRELLRHQRLPPGDDPLLPARGRARELKRASITPSPPSPPRPPYLARLSAMALKKRGRYLS